MYVVAPSGVIPVSTATNTLGRPIKIGAIPAAIAITPDGRTAYIADGNQRTVTPVSTATNTLGRPIKIGGYPAAIAITPDGKTAYVGTSSGTVTPINTASNTAGKPIKVAATPSLAIAITP